MVDSGAVTALRRPLRGVKVGWVTEASPTGGSGALLLSDGVCSDSEILRL